MKRSKSFQKILLLSTWMWLFTANALETGKHISFVSCPVVRDTSTVPCWISDYDETTYYLTIQSDVSSPVQPPMLGHQVLVEGIISDVPSICGGVVLDDVHLSVMPEIDANCNTVLPVEDRYTIDFHPRPPGPSSGRLAFDPVPGQAADIPPPLQGEQNIDIYFDFDKGVSFRHPGILIEILNVAAEIKASHARITGVRGAHLLSDGTLLLEAEDIGKRRAQEVTRLLGGAGMLVEIEVAWKDGIEKADGISDWMSRRVTVQLIP